MAATTSRNSLARRVRFVVYLWALLAFLIGPACAAENSVVHIGPTVDITGDVPGRVIAAAGSVSIDGRVSGDALVAAGRINITGTVQDNVVSVSGAFTLWPQAQVGGDLRIAAGDAEVSGAVGGDLIAAAGVVTVAGQIGGDVRVSAGKLVVLPGAVIGGRIVTHGPGSVEVSPDAQVLGGTAPPESPQPPLPPRPDRESRGTAVTLIGGALIFTFLRLPVVGIGTLAIGLLFLALFPRFAEDAAATLRDRPAVSVLMGFLGLAASPMIVAILAITILGLPLAVFVALAFVLVLIVAYGIGALALTSLVLRNKGPGRAQGLAVLPAPFWWRAIYLLIGLAVLGLARHLPVAGFAALWGTTAFGFGALLMEATRRWRGAV